MSGRSAEDRHMSSRVLILRRAATCCMCSAPLAAGTRAHWNAARRVVTCMSCREHSAAGLAERIGQRELDRDKAGASARRESLHRRSSREARARQRHPHAGRMLPALRRAIGRLARELASAFPRA